MFKKLDKLIIGAFLGPFILTFVVVVFILLTQYLLKYVDDFVGKNLGLSVFAELIFYFSLNMVPLALPLAILLSSIMTFGNLGEHHELTAIKSSGISLLRILLPISFFVVAFMVGSFFFNNIVVPKANLKAFSLLYDIRQKKPALDIREGVFYNGIPGYSIKVAKKYPDSRSLKEVLIYNHSNGSGNTDVIIADSGIMYTFNHEQYLALELFNGDSYTEYLSNNSNPLYPRQFIINEFDKTKLVFSLASFGLSRTPQELFSGNRLMKNIDMLNRDRDSLDREREKINKDLPANLRSFSTYNIMADTASNASTKIGAAAISNFKMDTVGKAKSDSSNKIKPDTINKATGKIKIDTTAKFNAIARAKKRASKIKSDTIIKASAKNKARAIANAKIGALKVKTDTSKTKADTLDKSKVASLIKPKTFRKDSFDVRQKKIILNRAVSIARSIKTYTGVNLERMDYLRREAHVNEIEKYRKYTQAVTCLVMFLIGAPLGAIIRKGGLGIPVLISIIFFILYYVLSIIAEKWAKESVIAVPVGMWAANVILFPVGLIFLIQAKNDSRIFEFNFNFAFLKKIKKFFRKK